RRTAQVSSLPSSLSNCPRHFSRFLFSTFYLKRGLLTMSQALMTQEITRTEVEDFLYYQARLLDERQFEQWFECFTEDAEYWMRAWDDDGELTQDPQTEISLIYYPERAGLGDRIFRIRTERSSATSLPDPRTGHNITNVVILERRENEVDIHFNWTNYNYRYATTDKYFSTTLATMHNSTDKTMINKQNTSFRN